MLGSDDAALLAKAEAHLLETCPALSAFDDGTPWGQWQEAIREALSEARPGGTLPMDSEASVAELRRPALARWPRSLPSPPEEPGGLWACLKQVTQQTEREGTITPEGTAAAYALYYLAIARAVPTRCGTHSSDGAP